MLAITLIDCSQDGDSDSINGDDDNGWTDDGCEYVYDGSQVQSENLSSSKPKDDFEDCIPELPDDVDPEPILKILEIYSGIYADENDAEITFTCRPEGTWEVPHYIPEAVCDYYWIIPIWIAFKNDDTTVEGATRQGGRKLDDVLNPSPEDTTLYVYLNDPGCEAEQWGSVDTPQWKFRFPEDWEGVVWTKVD